MLFFGLPRQPGAVWERIRRGLNVSRRMRTILRWDRKRMVVPIPETDKTTSYNSKEPRFLEPISSCQQESFAAKLSCLDSSADIP